MTTHPTPDWAGWHPPVHGDAATLHHDRAAIGDALITFVGRMSGLSDHARSLGGGDMADHLPDFLKGCESIRLSLGQAMPAHRKAAFDRLARLSQELELNRLAQLAAAQDLRHWDDVNAKVLETQVENVRRWPLDDRTFRQAAQDGLAIAAEHDRMMGRQPEASRQRQSAFLSRLTETRLQALVWTNIAVALQVFQDYQQWLLPAARQNCQKLLAQGERLARARILADAIVDRFAPDHWRQRAGLAAHCEYPDDADFAQMLQDRIGEHIDQSAQAQTQLARQTRNRLLLAALGDSQSRPQRIEDLWRTDPQKASLWHQTDDDTRHALTRILHANRTRLGPNGSAQSQRKFDLAVGLMALSPHHFLKLHFGQAGFRDLPLPQLQLLITMQEVYDDPQCAAYRTAMTAHVRKHLQAKSAIFRRHRLPILF